MERRKLEIEALELESFDVGSAGPPIGTIRAHVDPYAGDAAGDVAAEPKYTEEGYPAFTCTGWNCTLPGLCTCPDSCDPKACTFDGCTVAAG
ncbi:MAG TPA: hypothetical protein VF771_12020 [Longimicrobiaceae bacterium]